MSYQIEERGSPNTMDYKVYLSKFILFKYVGNLKIICEREFLIFLINSKHNIN